MFGKNLTVLRGNQSPAYSYDKGERRRRGKTTLGGVIDVLNLDKKIDRELVERPPTEKINFRHYTAASNTMRPKLKVFFTSGLRLKNIFSGD